MHSIISYIIHHVEPSNEVTNNNNNNNNASIICSFSYIVNPYDLGNSNFRKKPQVNIPSIE